MKALIVEDDFTSRLLLQELLKPYGATHIAVNGREAVEAVRIAVERRAASVGRGLSSRMLARQRALM